MIGEPIPISILKGAAVSDYDVPDSSLFSASPNAMHICKPKTKSLGLSFLLALTATAIGVVPLSGQTADTTPWKVSRGPNSSSGPQRSQFESSSIARW